MERVVKRYLMHNQGDLEDPKQNDFDDMKLDLQQIKYEIVNDMKKTREDNTRNMFIINNGVQFLTEELLTDKTNSGKDAPSENSSINSSESNQSMIRYKEFLNSNQFMLRSSILAEQHETTEVNANCSDFSLNNQNDFCLMRNKNSFEIIDNLNKNSPKSKSPSKVSFDLNENRFFSSPLSKILEESQSVKSDFKSS